MSLRAKGTPLWATHSFRRDERGAIAILFALLLVPLLLFVGGAIDFTRYNAVRADLIESMDAAGLAMAQMDAINPPEISDLEGAEREEALKEYGRQFFHENFKFASIVEGLSIDFTVTRTTITPHATGRLKTVLLSAAQAAMRDGSSGLEALELTTDTEITRRGSGRIELALVLDVTGSMADPVGGVDKIDSLRDAVDNLLDVMYGDRISDPNIKIGIVPFNAYVNPGGSDSWEASWGDQNALAPYHGARFFHVDANGNVDMSRRVNHYALFSSVTGGSWMGCVEARPYPLDELDTSPGVSISTSDVTAARDVPSAAAEPDARVRLAFTRAPNFSLATATLASAAASRWVPMFRADEPNCASSGSNCWGSWNDNENYVISGSTFTVNMDGYKIDDPSEDGKNNSSYSNRSFISDSLYSNRNQSGEQDARYWKVAHQIRHAQGDTSYGPLDANLTAFRDFLASYNGAQVGSDEYVGRMAYPGWWDPVTSTYKWKYDQSPSIDESISDTDSSMRGPNEDCPASILDLTDKREDVETKMDQLFPNGNTNSANGMVWGWRLLSPQAPFTAGVDQSGGQNTQWQKAIVLMTDGQNTVSNSSTHLQSAPSAYGYEIEQRMGIGVNNADDSDSAYSASSMRDQLDEKLLRICRRAKQENILVYTIIFGLDDVNLEQVFKSCATSPTAPYYYKAPTRDQLEAAFGQIAQDLVNLHVSR
jgi:hypothetical protein